jgi:hypothetical protein
MHPRSRTARARRWAGVAVRWVRPTSKGIRVPRGRKSCDPFSRPRPVAPSASTDRPGPPAVGRDHDRRDRGITRRPPHLGLRQGVPAAGLPQGIAGGGLLDRDGERDGQTAPGRQPATGMGFVDQLHECIGAPGRGRHVVGRRAQPLGQGVDRGDHELPLHPGQFAAEDHRLTEDGERQRPRLMRVCLIGAGVVRWVQQPGSGADEPGDRRRRPRAPVGVQLLDDSCQLLGTEPILHPGERIDVVGGHDPRRPCPRNGREPLREPGAPGQSARPRH